MKNVVKNRNTPRPRAARSAQIPTMIAIPPTPLIATVGPGNGIFLAVAQALPECAW